MTIHNVPLIMNDLAFAFDFYLTGSRYFGNALQHSDWDFYAQYSKELIIFLEKRGFEEEENHSYDDLLNPTVYWHKVEQVHIQLYHSREALLKKHIAHNLITYIKNILPKDNTRDDRIIWNITLSIVNTVLVSYYKERHSDE